MAGKDFGGAAFPTSDTYPGGVRGGMTLRDWFAGQALAGLLSINNSPNLGRPEMWAEAAYQMADAMLEVRK